MKTKPTHAPTPWEVTESGSDIEIQDADGTSIAVVIEEDKVEVAQRIVRAVNAHDEFVEALKKISRYNGSTGGLRALVNEIHFIANEAIAKAEGKL